MKKYLGTALMLGLILAVSGMVWFGNSQRSLSAQGGVFSSPRQWITRNFTTPNASTTMVWLNSATTTYTLNVEGVDQVNLNLFTTASSTTDNLYWYYAFANATTTDSDTWFREDASSASGAVTTHNMVQMTHIWNPAATGTSTKNVLISNINSKYMQVGFWSGTTTTNVMGLWAEAVLSKPY